jgi:hypothetical protein
MKENEPQVGIFWLVGGKFVVKNLRGLTGRFSCRPRKRIS